MRGTRWLLVLAILAILGGVSATYRLQKRVLQSQAPAKPAALPLELNSAAEDWRWQQTSGGRTVVEITARNVRQVKETSQVELEKVELRLYHQDGTVFDLVKSAQAQFSQSERRLYSDGDVDITLGVPMEGQPRRTLVSIHSSGVTFDSTTGKASTGRAASFVFENGTGKAVGASYDPSTKELRMQSQVELNWQKPGPHTKPMKVEAGELVYNETGSVIMLSPWARLTRENTVIESAGALVHLENGAIRQIEAQKGHGTDSYPGRQLRYGADQLLVMFSDAGTVEKVTGEPNASLLSTAATSQTSMNADRVDLEFATADGESVLTRALANGNGMVESKPLPAAGRLPPETRLLHSQVIEVKMRPGGREIEEVVTHAPGTVEFLPNRAGQHRRKLDGERMSIAYAANNQIESFTAVNARTETEPTPEEKAHNRVVSRTSSKGLLAHFDPKTGQLTRMEQWDDFTYDEGDRKARAVRAVMEPLENVITLETKARLWDSTGSTAADHIRMDQRTDHLLADGHVTSSRLPDKKKSASEMLNGDEPLQAIAATMTASDHNRLIHYEGKVVLWQGASRVQADRVDIDRVHRRLVADGSVATQFMEQPKAEKKAAPKEPLFTLVRAQHLLYTEENRLATYTGGVVMTRPGLNVKSAMLRAYLAESGADSRIEKAYADQHVEIVQTSPGRRRTGTGEHAEYYTANQKIVLRGGLPQLVDSLRGSTRGTELTYFANDDRLLVNGLPDRPATSRIRRK